MDEFPERILIVDDEISTLEMLDDLLFEFERDLVESGEEAVEHLNNERYGLLLCDKNLPGMGGIEVLKRAREIQPSCACIMMTAFGSKDSAIEALRLGANDYVEKPFDSIVLLRQRITATLDRQRLAWQRDRLLKAIDAFRHELDEERGRTERGNAEIELFNEILELRVRDTTARLRQEIEQLIRAVESGLSIDEVLETMVRELLDHIRQLASNIGTYLDSTVSAVMYSQLAGVAQRVEEVLDLILHARGKEASVEPYKDPKDPP